jgi:hypothetical protein
MKSGREQSDLGYPLWKILGESVLYFTSQILKGYIQEGKGKRRAIESSREVLTL